MTESPEVLVVQHVAEEPPSAVATAIAGAGGTVRLVRTYGGDPVPASIEGCSGLVVMGGPMGVYEADRWPHLRDELRLIESALARQVPTLGICLGSQLLASALGATVRPGRHKEIGWFPVSVEPAGRADQLLGAAPASFTPLHWHGDVFDLPPGATALARSELTALQAFQFGGFAHGLLFHLEVTQPQLATMTGAFADELRAAGVSPASLRDGWGEHGVRLEALARVVFGGWMGRVRALSRRSGTSGRP